MKNTGRSKYNLITFGRKVQWRKIKGEGVCFWTYVENRWLSGKITGHIFFLWIVQIVDVFNTILMRFNFKEVDVDVEITLDLPGFSEHLMKWSWEGGDDKSVGESIYHWLVVCS